MTDESAHLPKNEKSNGSKKKSKKKSKPIAVDDLRTATSTLPTNGILNKQQSNGDTPSINKSLSFSDLGNHNGLRTALDLNIPTESDIRTWSTKKVGKWLEIEGFGENIVKVFEENGIDGLVLIELKESDLMWPKLNISTLGEVKHLWRVISRLQNRPKDEKPSPRFNPEVSYDKPNLVRDNAIHYSESEDDDPHEKATVKLQHMLDSQHLQDAIVSDPHRTILRRSSSSMIHLITHWKHGDREAFSKLIFSLFYLMIVCFITSFTMTVVHDRVPDPATYPPLPDIFLDNITMVPWAFQLVEFMILGLATALLIVLFFHSHRMIIFRRFCAIGGSVFLLRCFTMFATSLSVPGAHLNCDARVASSLDEKLVYAWKIISNFGMSINGVRTCGDYMFSGHTIILTLLNFFVNEYSPRNWKGIEILSWMFNIAGMFFILAAHEHYTIDVFIAFFISSRTFLYYHSLANTAALKGDGHERIRSFFPMFSYLEEHTDGIVPNEYEWPWSGLLKKFTDSTTSASTTSKVDDKKKKKNVYL